MDPEGRADNDDLAMFGPLERSGTVRALLVVVVAVVIGVLLLPSAARTGKGESAAAASKPTVTTTAPAASASRPAVTTTTPAVPFSSIKVLVANGTNINGAAGTVSSQLSGKGFVTLSPVDALTTVPKSQVYAVGSNAAAAREVVSALGLGSSAIEPSSTPVPVSNTAGAAVVVVVGPDLASHS